MSKERILSRDTDAVAIPSGNTVILPAGTTVQIVQVLGGNFTVLCPLGMVRISWRNADALGEEVKEPVPVNHFAAATAAATGAPDELALWDALKTVFDPEIPVNIVDLGLVYSLASAPAESATGHQVEMAMTLTAPGCGMGPTIAEDARGKLMSVPGVSGAKVHLVWDPPWNQSMISEEGKMKLGLI